MHCWDPRYPAFAAQRARVKAQELADTDTAIQRLAAAYGWTVEEYMGDWVRVQLRQYRDMGGTLAPSVRVEDLSYGSIS